ncbi:MAG: histidinol-phosphate transaminase [Bdellovibrionota bacterium]
MIERPKHIRELTPYQPGKTIQEASRDRAIAHYVKLASNENPMGVSPMVVEAISQSCSSMLHLYPEKRDPELLGAIANHLGVSPKRLVCTAGIDSLLAYILMAFSSQGEEILTSEGSFIGIYVNAQKLGRTVKTVPLRDWTFDLDAISRACTDQTRIIYVANPNNPTSTAFGYKRLRSFLDRIPKHVLIILDEAYFEYAREFEDYPNGIDLHQENVIVCRTMSKAYGLAGLRMGYAYATEGIVEELLKVRLPFEPSILARVAAHQALLDQNFLEEILELNRRSLKFLQNELDRIGISYVPNSRCNFLMMLFDSAQIARQVVDQCLNQGIILRGLESFGIDRGVRINTGTDDQNQLAISCLEKIVKTMQ